MAGKFKFAIDRGGTFTDIFAIFPNGQEKVLKLLSVNPGNYHDAPTEGIRRIVQEATGKRIPINEPIDTSNIEWIRMGTTVATNALLERKGERIALVITKGFRDLLYIGNQARPKLFDLQIQTPSVLYEEVVEVDCRVVPSRGDNSQSERVTGITKQEFDIHTPLNKTEVRTHLSELKQKGIESIAVVLMHSYTYIEDELEVGRIAKSLGFKHVSLSHDVMPMVRIVGRGYTACTDAYLTPCIKTYIQGFASGFKDNLENVNVLFMQSDGGLTPMNSFIGSRAVLSGPAGGVVGYAVTTHTDKPVIGFDMGGTSTDVSRYAGSYEHIFECTTAGVTIQAPQLDVNTVAAGGGSRLFFRSGIFIVGPESAGAYPGPVCYRNGGYLTVTDANLVLGRLLPDYFPHIFGKHGDLPLNKEATIAVFEQLTDKINAFQIEAGKPTMSVNEVAMGFIKVANETMCRPIRSLTEGKGYDTRNHILACFGGAAAQHACAISKSLGIKTVVIHKYAGILSAYGMACADVVEEKQEPCAKTYSEQNFSYFDERLNELSMKCKSALLAQGFTVTQIKTEYYLHLRYEGTDGALMCTAVHNSNKSTKHGDFLKTFLERYKTEFGFTLSERKIFVDDIRVRANGCSSIIKNVDVSSTLLLPDINGLVRKVVDVYFEEGDVLKTNVFFLSDLKPGHSVDGPAIIIDQLSTILVEPRCTAKFTKTGNIEISIDSNSSVEISEELDTIQLSIFSHRFMSIAEQMGRILQRTSVSTNIKERLDFSCALFGPDGGLVSNAPHIPVHLGAMQETVQYQLKNIGNQLVEGDVILSNHPQAGGSHLPDLTVITPVFYRKSDQPVFFVASRGHHADIGGITPGSMPAHSKLLIEEGATFKSFFLVKGGVFQEKELIEALMAPGKVPNSSGTRNLSDNLSDLKAQIAANQKGCLTPVRVIIPNGCILDPSENAAVVGGNVLTSQRLVDVIFRAFNAAAASQGCTNNITFGGDGWGYYETVGGGSGAGPTWHGRSGVHVHMTNTRITDPEILEQRYPIILERFSLRPNSGGKGKFRGGDGVIREMLFRTNLTLSILTERRVFAPYGLAGGEPGEKGENLLIRDGRTIRMPSKTEVNIQSGDKLVLLTPGGGGYGNPNEGDDNVDRNNPSIVLERGSVYQYRMQQEST